jgi:hypothetical protein
MDGNGMNNPNDRAVVPFGKYKDQPVEVLAGDPAYANWLTAQPWFRDKFANIYNVIINNTGEPAETPEHNQLQALFLDDEFCLRFLAHSCPGQVQKDLKREWVYCLERFNSRDRCEGRRWVHEARSHSCTPNCDRCYERAWTENLIRDGLTHEVLPITQKITQREFEYSDGGRRNVDVLLSVTARVDAVGIYTCVGAAIEVKPSVGDDYPAVLRQMRSNGAKYLFPRDYHGVGATQAQFVQMFKSAGIHVVFANEV